MKKNIPIWLVVHHTGGTDADPLADTSHHTFEMVNEWHRVNPNVWLGEYSTLGFAIGYHWFIDKSGKATQGRADTDEGAHCKNYNTSSIGICLAGNFDLTLPTKAQEDSLKKLLEQYTVKYGITKDKVVPHRVLATKTCYGMRLPVEWAKNLLTKPPEVNNNKEIVEKIKVLLDGIK